MKVLIFILNIYILTLYLLPCEDKAEFDVSSTDARISLSGNTNKSPVADEFVPFCTCTCCSVVKTIPDELAVTGQIKFLSPVQFSILPVSAPRAISRAIWQPPQLGQSTPNFF